MSGYYIAVSNKFEDKRTAVYHSMYGVAIDLEINFCTVECAFK